MSVVLHEFAHGIVAYWGGDYTIRERGGLTLNPLQYVDPMLSIVMPLVFLLLGGVPLPGGVTYVRTDLLRNRRWETATALAGPAMNLLLFFICAIPLHPHFGWTPDFTSEDFGMSPAQSVLAVMAMLQIVSVCLNLIPIPPLDGFNAISPYLDPELRQKVGMPPASVFLMIGFFMILTRVDFFGAVYDHVATPLLRMMGFDMMSRLQFQAAFGRVFR